ncbi:MAG: hypothetical protein IKT86_06360 [Bacteroidaceae bacterium]|nr:hypothetical protein [Bacteroidaceae bacterium]
MQRYESDEFSPSVFIKSTNIGFLAEVSLIKVLRTISSLERRRKVTIY